MLRIDVYTKILMYIYYLHKIFYSFENIFISFCPKNMILGVFWRVIIGLQKTSLNQQDQFTITSLFSVLESQKWKTKTAGPVFCGLGPVQLQSFFSLGTGLPSTTPINCILPTHRSIPCTLHINATPSQNSGLTCAHPPPTCQCSQHCKHMVRLQPTLNQGITNHCKCNMVVWQQVAQGLVWMIIGAYEGKVNLCASLPSCDYNHLPMFMLWYSILVILEPPFLYLGLCILDTDYLRHCCFCRWVDYSLFYEYLAADSDNEVIYGKCESSLTDNWHGQVSYCLDEMASEESQLPLAENHLCHKGCIAYRTHSTGVADYCHSPYLGCCCVCRARGCQDLN